MIHKGARVEMVDVPGCRGTLVDVKELRFGSYAMILPDGGEAPLPIPWTDIRELGVLEVLAELGETLADGAP